VREGRVSGFRRTVVAAVCVYPNMVPIAKAAVAGSGVKVASVATAFPSGLSSLDVKLRDTEAALTDGAMRSTWSSIVARS